MLKKINKFNLTLLTLFIASLLSTFLSLKMGGVENISNEKIYQYFKSGEGPFILTELRLPRVILCWVV
ncbi:MAG: hypothetical protein VXW15_06390, partial [Bdellovibrionota bacterium]|nr:hypothetical protein [Bdellovibrionota bacterium]